MDVYQMIVGLREAGLSQTFIGEQVNCSQSTVGRLEKKEVSPNYRLVQRIESFYNQFQQDQQKSA